VPLDAAGTTDPDGDALRFRWFFYPEAGMGIPGDPVRVRTAPPLAPAPPTTAAPSVPSAGPREPPPRLRIEGASGTKATLVPKAPGIAHVILEVKDDGRPSLTSYRRVILNVKSATP
jgi:hypothetical protein